MPEFNLESELIRLSDEYAKQIASDRHARGQMSDYERVTCCPQHMSPANQPLDFNHAE